jgi:hypothetical protein
MHSLQQGYPAILEVLEQNCFTEQDFLMAIDDHRVRLLEDGSDTPKLFTEEYITNVTYPVTLQIWLGKNLACSLEMPASSAAFNVRKPVWALFVIAIAHIRMRM